MSSRRRELAALAASVSADALEPHARSVDRDARFPHEGVAALHASGLLWLMAPADLGGLGGDHRDLVAVGTRLGRACPSTALIWAMHNQQVAVLANHGGGEHRRLLVEAGRQGHLVASVTAELPGSGPQSVEAPLIALDGGRRLAVRRTAPIVSYGEQAHLFLVTMRAGSAGRPGSSADARLVAVTRDDGEIACTGGWDAHGMRGTCSVPLTFDVIVDAERVFEEPFGTIMSRSMIPTGHLAWASVWYGIAVGGYERVLGGIRNRRLRIEPTDPFVLASIAKHRAGLEVMAALLDRTARRTDASGASVVDRVADPTPAIELNTLKIVVSRTSRAVIDGLIELVGLLDGYTADSPLRLEQGFRDVRSASLMIANRRLQDVNGRLALVERSSRLPLLADD